MRESRCEGLEFEGPEADDEFDSGPDSGRSGLGGGMEPCWDEPGRRPLDELDQALGWAEERTEASERRFQRWFAGGGALARYAAEPGLESWGVLERAVASDRRLALAWLVAAGADLEEPGDFGSRPLHVAAWRQKPWAVAALVEAGAEVDSRGEDGFTPLALALEAFDDSESAREIVEALVGAGADPEALDDHGSSARSRGANGAAREALGRALALAQARELAAQIPGPPRSAVPRAL